MHSFIFIVFVCDNSFKLQIIVLLNFFFFGDYTFINRLSEQITSKRKRERENID